ncbi:NTP transferase domain-containing protein [Sporosarcina sp. JAI121]|uniref:nucleotidyltransferase family protein n=1 Tax=Sporosarcina sp. JAI121 TaxID=2723064 RepID=UPI0015CC70C1|nr:nucleotidyltransferase family protein [Sporosarcina sp. JAI121]NYF24693.1 molybdenum cofactor cytidylyltransferase [Sporosarcina sp. JAI121]
MKIVGIYLAAGNSGRMGTHKLALPVGTMTVGSLALETALKAPLDEIYVITTETDDADWLPAEMKSHAKCTIINCSATYEGQSESLRCGIQRAQADRADAVIVLLADQPFITVRMIEEMIACTKDNPTCRFVATTYDQSIMPPVLFSSSMYNELLSLRGDKGARAILQGDYLRKGKLLPCTDKRFVCDVDTEDDYQTLQEIAITK